LAGTSSARRGGSASIGRREWMSTRPSRESMPAWCAVQVFWLPSLPPSPAPPPSSSSAPRRAGCRAVPSPRLPALPHHARHRHPAPLPQNPHLPLAPWLVFGSSAHTPPTTRSVLYDAVAFKEVECRRLGHIDKLEKQVYFSLGSDMEHAPTHLPRHLAPAGTHPGSPRHRLRCSSTHQPPDHGQPGTRAPGRAGRRARSRQTSIKHHTAHRSSRMTWSKPTLLGCQT